jgi:hypothetical protein
LQDNASFAFVSGELGGAQLNGVGIFVKPAAAAAAPVPAKTAAAAAGGVNYLLGITNSTFITALETYAGLDTPVPLFMLLATNISWGQLLSDSNGMLDINRHLYLAGQGGVLTGIDFGSKVNQVALTGQWSNITFQGLALENLGLGNRWATQHSLCAAQVLLPDGVPQDSQLEGSAGLQQHELYCFVG